MSAGQRLPKIAVTEHLRHVDKTAQDKLPMSERQRVKDWHKRLQSVDTSES